MAPHITTSDARDALATVERGRRRVLDEFDMPRWYWWGLALGWIALAAVIDTDHPWLGAAATLVFGAAHATAFNIVAGGRRRTGRLSIRTATIGRHPQVLVLACLIGLGAVTVGGALLAHADGAGHPVTIASVPIAVAILLGGPVVMAAIRRRVTRTAPGR